MGVETKIQWAHHTFNGWIGCTEAGPECDHCYAREQNKHWKWNGGVWGPGTLRKITSSAKWREPLKWNEAAKAAGERRRVFAFSLADVFDAEGPAEALPFLWEMIERTDWLDWLLLTKRPHLITRNVPSAWLVKPRPNVWFGTSVGTQATANVKVGHLLKVPAAVRWLSMEPLLEPVNVRRLAYDGRTSLDALNGGIWERVGTSETFTCIDDSSKISWIVLGGESGHDARPFDLAWARSLVKQGRDAGCALFVKQLGANPVGADVQGTRGGLLLPDALVQRSNAVADQRAAARIKDRKGGDPSEWPADLRVREFPAVTR